MGQAVQQVRTVLALVAAILLLIAPLGMAQAMPCHGHAHHGHVATAGYAAIHPEQRQANHKACTGTMCCTCLALLAVGPSLVQPMASVRRYDRYDQAGSGMTPPPPLDPPRTQV